ncbi:hypothetical protein [Adlercreutzia muris]|uniref:hypothetical protein n=1 Tax=Adlercreutzia muris TaxID=1796610 RepID=UPI001F5A8924|nr:hypothetical protein [Adlercreutzia muris]
MLDRTILDLLVREMEQQRASLRLLDNSLHQLSFAYIAAFALCVPAVFAGGRDTDALLGNAETMALVSFILCTIFYFGGFYALMLIRSRNLCVARIGLLGDSINTCIRRDQVAIDAIPYEFSENMADAYYGKWNGKLWFGAYVLFFIPVLAGCVYALVTTWEVNIYLSIVLLVEITLSIAFYVVYFATSGGKRLRNQLRRSASVSAEKTNRSEPDERL